MGKGTVGKQDKAGETAAAPSHIIKRPRLTKILDETEARIILLCAPAGYGKTTLAREWVATRSEPVLWYSGGPAMADVAALAVDLAELFAGRGGDGPAQVRNLAAANETPHRLARAVADVSPPSECLVVIDDYHFAHQSEGAGDLIREIVTATEFRLLITSRECPSWIGARRVIYGEAVTIGPELLALDDAEASAVLPRGDFVFGQARGWPALIGLAARMPAAQNLDTELSPTQLYNFIAAELFDAVDGTNRENLFRLALGGDATRAAADSLLGAERDSAIEFAVEKGFAIRDADGWISIHPLLRAFLLDQLAETARAPDLANEVIGVLHREGHWDQCLAALQRFPDATAACRVLSDALPELLKSGRTETVQHWIAFATENDFRQGIFRLATSEVALREGRYLDALVIAEDAAGVLEGDLAARAYLTAARAAHQTGDDDATFDHAQRADELATTAELRTEAIWIASAKAYECDPGRVHEFTERLASLDDPRPEHKLRVIHAEAFNLMGSGGSFREALALAERGVVLSRDVRDPLLRTSTLHVQAHLLRVCAEYDRAADAASKLVEEGVRAGLDFVVDHALVTRAAALTGVRSLSAAQDCLRQIEVRARASTHLAANATLVRARMKVAAGDIDGAALVLGQPIDLPSLGIQGEFLGVHALVQAARGDLEAARLLIEAARDRERWRYTDGATHVAMAEAIATAQSGGAAEEIASTVRAVLEIGNCDVVVVACRAFPELAKLAVAGGAHNELQAVLSAAGDIDLGRRAGLSMPREYRRREGLSPRETDVYELLVQGRSTPEIAERLYISESTTKVHIKHIFEKLGVHSRAEAAAARPRLKD